jgi:class 3 adenylate cyclase
MLPSSDHAIKLLKGEFILDELHDVTLLYSDIKGFTPLSSSMHPIRLCELLNEIYSSFDKHLNEFGMYKVDIIGDAFVVIGGLPGSKDKSQHAHNTVLFAFHMLEDIKNIKQVDPS